jgi:peptide/nickel transport system substrate-binding protein
MPISLSYNQVMIFKLLIIQIFILLSSEASMSPLENAKHLRIAISSVPNSLDPLHATDANSQNINRLQFLSLIDTNEEMDIKCRACKQFEVLEVDGNEVLGFELRKDLYFQDGEKITSRDVYNSWLYYTDPNNKSVFKSAFDKIQKIEIIDNYNLRFHFAERNAENLSNLVLLKLMKREKGQVIESGPYNLENLSSMQIRLKARKNHFEMNENLPDSISMHVVRDETTLALRLLKEEVDLSTAQISPRKEQWLLSRKRTPLQVFKTTGTNTIYLGINHQSEHLSSRNVRKAISHLIPRELLNKYKLRGSVELSTGLFSRVFSGLYLNQETDKYDIKKAKKLLMSEGYILSNGLWVKDGKPLSLDWKATNNRASLEMVEVLRAYFLDNGIIVNLTIQEWGTFSRSIRNGRFDIFMGQWVGLAGPEMLGFVFHSKRVPPLGANRGKYINSEFDRLYDQGLLERDQKKSTEYFRKAHKVAIDDYAYIQLWHPEIRWIARSCIEVKRLYSSGSFLSLLNLNMNCKD